MKRCSLCGRKISNEKYSFGLGCLKKVCRLLKIVDVKNITAENKLNNKIQQFSKKLLLNKTQKQLLTNRYLTHSFLKQVNITYYQEIAKSISKDIKK